MSKDEDSNDKVEEETDEPLRRETIRKHIREDEKYGDKTVGKEKDRLEMERNGYQ